MAPISSRNSVPPSAASNRPFRRPSAPVKAPFSWPNSSDSIRVGESVEQLRVTNGPCHRLRQKVQPVGRQFLAGSPLAEQQHRPLNRGYPGKPLLKLEKALGLAQGFAAGAKEELHVIVYPS